MHTFNNLFDQIVNEHNIRKAILKASLGKRKKRNVKKILDNIDYYVPLVRKMLIEGTWEPVQIHDTIEINDGIEMKKRTIVCPSFLREQVVHHAIMNVCEPLFRNKFYEYSCGSIKGRGAERAKKYISKILRKYPETTKYVAKLDIKKFFPNVKPSFVFREIRRTIRDRRVLGLFAKILRGNVQRINGKIVKQGLPIGFYTSPILSNVLLNSLDHYIKDTLNINHYVRYIDDMLLFSSKRRHLKKACKDIQKWLGRVGLTVKPTWQVHPTVSITYLGYQYKRNGHVRLRDHVFLKTIRCVRRVSKKRKERTLTIHDSLRILSYLGRFKHASTYQAFKKYISPIVNVREFRRRVSRFVKKFAQTVV